MGSTFSIVQSTFSLTLLAITPFLVAAIHIVPYILDAHSIRWVSGPWMAKLSDAWLGWISGHGHRSEIVHELHMKHGKFVRIAPNHVSVADPDALQAIYGHGNGTHKPDFYDAFVSSLGEGLFNTRDRVVHTRKRKIVSHVFSQKNVLEFEPNVRLYIRQFIERLDGLYERAVKGGSGPEGEGGWRGRDGRLWLDCLPWYNYLAFDIIGDLAFGTPFGMIQAAKDAAPVATSHKDAMASYGISKLEANQVVEIPAVQILNDRGEFSATLGVIPAWWRPFVVKWVPWFKNGERAVHNLAGIAVAAVAQRLTTPTDRVDLLAKLQEGKDDAGEPMGKEELTAEALTQLIAGSDTTSNSSCAITYHLAYNPRVREKLQKELDEALGAEDEIAVSFEQVKRLSYLEAVINETLRLHSTSGIGLPRTAPEGGLQVLDKFFPEGTILSVPTYTIHRDTAIWGEDVDVFRPERWFERDYVGIQKAFNPFSYGPRGCVGRNLAFMELQLIIGSVLRHYDFVLEKPEKLFDTNEGFLRKPLECVVGIRRRNL